MKKIMVACGTGMATSTMIVENISSFLQEEGIEVQINQCMLTELPNHDGGYDLFVTSMKIHNDFETPVVTGTPFLIGVDTERVKKEILNILNS